MSITITLCDPQVVEFVESYSVDVEALVKSLIPHIDTWVLQGAHSQISTDSHIPTSEIRNEMQLSTIMTGLQRALDDSHNHIATQNTAAISQLKLDLSNELRDIHTKTNENSSVKGARSEQRVMNTLLKNYPSFDISDSSKDLHCCDIRVTFDSELTVLVENKDYRSKNIPRKEVDKFLTDLQFHNTSGVMFSQSSGIANKHNFQLDIISDTTVALYVSNVDHEPNIIVAAIDIIKNVTTLLRNYRSTASKGVRISDEQLRGISAELNTYNAKITQVRQLVNKFEKDLMATVGAIDFRVTTEMVNGGAAAFTQPSSIPNETVQCTVCQKEFKCKGALTKHTNKVHPNPNPNNPSWGGHQPTVV